MTPGLLALTPLLPLLMALAAAVRRCRGGLRYLAPAASLPALLLALGGAEGVRLELPWLLLHGTLALDDTGRMFLLLAALLWMLAALHLRVRADSLRELPFFFSALAGAAGMALAQDLALFYLGYAAMSFSAYGLIIARRSPAALRAGTVYIALVVLGEALLLAALLLIAHAAEDMALATVPATVAAALYRDWIVALVLGGFGVKIGMFPLHVSLPVAYAVTPAAGLAVLGGAMPNLALLGWLRMLPLGAAPLTGLGEACLALGAAAILYSAIAGLMQTQPQVVLAYSSVGQAGLALAAIGVAFAEPAAWPAAQAMLMVFALHQGCSKAALFLGLGMHGENMKRRWLLPVLLLPALALAGFPGSGGALAKHMLKTLGAAAPGVWPEGLQILLPLASLATILLMLRTFGLMRQTQAETPSNFLTAFALAAAVSAALLLPWWAAGVVGLQLDARALGGTSGLWPVVAGVLLGAAGAAWWRGRAAPHIPPGDWLVALLWLWRLAQPRLIAAIGCLTAAKKWLAGGSARLAVSPVRMAFWERTETWLRAPSGFGLVFIALTATLWWLLR